MVKPTNEGNMEVLMSALATARSAAAKLHHSNGEALPEHSSYKCFQGLKFPVAVHAILTTFISIADSLTIVC